MKVRNIAFFGVMASILGVGYANADTPATVIASKAYADTKEATANKKTLGSATWATITDTDKTSDVKFPTMKVLNSAVSHAVANVDLSGKVDKDQGAENKDKVFVTDGSGKEAVYSLGDNLTIDHTNKEVKVSGLGTAAAMNVTDTYSATGTAPISGKGVANAFSTLSNNTATGSGTVVKGVTQANGKITATMGTISTSDVASTALATSISASPVNTKLATEKAVSDAITAAAPATEAQTAVTGATAGKLATVGSVQNDVQYLKGVGFTNHTATANGTTISENKDAASTAWNKTITTDKKADDRLPTVAAVEARVAKERTEIDVALGGKVNTSSIVSDYSSTGTAPINGTGVKKALETLDSDMTASNKVFTKIAIKDGKLDSANSTQSEVTSAMIANGTITNTDINASAGIEYSKMLNTLKDINSASQDATCSVSNPCVLSYTGTKFKWTNMETDGLSAQQ